MGAVLKAELFFNNIVNSLGWSEVYYPNDPNIINAVADTGTLIVARLNLLVDQVYLAYGRVSTTGLPRDALVTSHVGETGTYAPAGAVILPLDGALLVTFQTDASHKNHKFLHGLTSADVSQDVYVPSVAWIANLLTFVNQLKAKFATVTQPGNVQGAIVDVFAERFTERRVGRPFGLRRGRYRT